MSKIWSANQKGKLRELSSLSSLAGELAKYYENLAIIDSKFSISSMKMGMSILEVFNKIRNDQSYALVNEVLNNIEATYMARTISALLIFIDDIEKYSNW